MPQLDIFTFFPQIFWGFLFFFVQFFVISYFFLPLLASTLKFKQKYLSMLFQNDHSVKNFNTSIPSNQNSNFLLLSSLKEIEVNFCNISKCCDISDKNTRLNLLTKTFGKVNNQLIKLPFFFCALSCFYAFSLPNSGNKKL